ncbi:hypothetical protein Lser_V15G12442 [Lactuca serriola]
MFFTGSLFRLHTLEISPSLPGGNLRLFSALGFFDFIIFPNFQLPILPFLF